MPRRVAVRALCAFLPLLLLSEIGMFPSNRLASPNLNGVRDTISASTRAYLSHLELLYGLDDPYAVAVTAWKEFRIFPLSFARSETKWEARPREASLADIYNDHVALSHLSLNKTKDWAFIIPGDISTYIYGTDETAYINGYREAWKAHTWAKNGVDCNRHLEIIASGTIPIFRNIQSVPGETLFAYPKRLMAFFEEHKDEADPAKLHIWRHLMLKWGHSHLTAPAMVRYMAKVTRVDLDSPLAPLKRIAYINDHLVMTADYLAAAILIGLVEWLGYARVDVFYFPDYLIEGNKRESKTGRALYGAGFGYANVLRKPEKAFRRLDEMLASLQNGEYAAVVWGSWHRSKAHFADIAYPAYINRREALWLCDGEDGFEGWPYLAEGKIQGKPLHDIATIFVRELHNTAPLKAQTLPGSP